MQLLWIGLTACRSAFSIFIISALGRTVKSVLGAFAIYFRLIKCNMCSKVCSQKAKERKNQRSYALSFGAEDGTYRGLTNSPLDCWFRHFGAVALFRLAVPESGCASCAACLLRPPRLLRLPVSAAGGGRLCSKSSAPNTKQKSPWRGTPWGPLFGAEDGT